MFLFAALIALQPLPEYAYARHGPPSNYQALQTIQADFFNGGAAIGYQSDKVAENPRFPIDVQLFSCEFNADRRLTGEVGRGEAGIIPSYAGYDCIMDVYPLGNPKYQVYGFFYHTGLEWRYYGTLVETLVIRSDRYGNDLIASRQSAKPGGVTYDGQPFGTSLIENPYNNILERYENPAARRESFGTFGF